MPASVYMPLRGDAGFSQSLFRYNRKRSGTPSPPRDLRYVERGRGLCLGLGVYISFQSVFMFSSIIMLLIFGCTIQIPIGKNQNKKNSPAKSENVASRCNSTVLNVLATK